MRRRSRPWNVQMPSSGVGPASTRSSKRSNSGPERRGGRPGWGRSGSASGPLRLNLADPLLDGAWATAEGRRDAAGGAALGGENDRLIAEPGAFVAEGFGPALEFVEG